MEVKSAAPATGYVVASSVRSPCTNTTACVSSSRRDSCHAAATSAGKVSSSPAPTGTGSPSSSAEAGLAIVTVPSSERPMTPSLKSLSSTSTRSRSYSTWAKAPRSRTAMMLKVAAGNGFGAALDALQAPGDEVRRQIAEQKADAHRQDRGEEQLALDGRHRGVDVSERCDDEDHAGHGVSADVDRHQRHGRRRVAAGARGHHALHD